MMQDLWQGIGRQMALQIAKRGGKLVLWDLDGKALQEAADEVQAAVPGCHVATYVCDLSKKAPLLILAVCCAPRLSRNVMEGSYLHHSGARKAE